MDTRQIPRLQLDEPSVFQRLVWWCRLRCAAIMTGVGLVVIAECVAFVVVVVPYHLRAIDEAEQRGYDKCRQESGDVYHQQILEIARKRLDG